jgi:hypothetical protein
LEALAASPYTISVMQRWISYSAKPCGISLVSLD